MVIRNNIPPPPMPPIRKHQFPSIRLRLKLEDLSHKGSAIFLKHFNAASDLEEQVQNVLNLLYTPKSSRPDTRSVTVVLRDSEGVAYTTGTSLDNDHKEIHLHLGYIAGVSGDVRLELLGVICHELVHCFQWDARGTCPGGLIEGLADYVRLNAGVGAKHWKREADGAWDGGYQHTGFFLDYLERRFGEGTIKKMNATLEEGDYDEKKLFSHCCDGNSVQDLWEQYRKEVQSEGQSADAAAEAHIPVPTHAAGS